MKALTQVLRIESLLLAVGSGFIVWLGQSSSLAQSIPQDRSSIEVNSTSLSVPATLDASYRLGAGDRINMDVFNVPDYSREYPVLSDGTVNLPLIGVVSLQGLTLEQATLELTNRYQRYIRRPVITLSLVSTRPIQLAIVGEVKRPGSYTVSATGTASSGVSGISGTPTLTQALQLAGGVTELANIRSIEIRRPLPQNPNITTKVEVNLWELLQAGNLNQDVALQDGDTVLVPTAVALSPGEATELSEASFSPESITVNVVGEVTQPGAISVPPNTPMNQALLAAGGFNNRAAKGEVQLVRLNPDGTVSRRTIEVDFTHNVNEQTNPVLRNNDAIVVERSAIAEASDATNSVIQPVSGILGVIRLILGLF